MEAAIRQIAFVPVSTALAWVGCASPQEQLGPSSLVDFECGVLEADVTLAETAVSTIFRAGWTSDGQTSGSVHFLVDGDEDTQVVEDAQPTRDHALYLLGVPANQSFSYQIVDDGGDGPMCSEVMRGEAGGLPGLPEFDVEVPLPSEAENGFLIAPILQTELAHIVIVDTQGRLVWSAEVHGTVQAARMSRDRQSILYNRAASSDPQFTEIVKIGLDGVEAGSLELVDSHTDFVELEDGRVLTLLFDVRDVAGFDDPIIGDRLVEVQPDSSLIELWSTFDDLTPEPGSVFESGWYRPDPTAGDWSHANGISYDKDSDSVLVSVGGLDTLARIDRGGGGLIESISIDSASLSVEAEVLDAPHSVQGTSDDRILLFNRNLTSGLCSEAIELQIDRVAGTAEEVWAYTGECLNVYYLGQALRLDSSNTLVVFSTAGRIDQVTPRDELAWRLQFDLGAGVGFSDFVPIP